MKKVVVSAMLAMGMGNLLGLPAQAQSGAALGAPTSPPIGWVQFCQENQSECASRNLPAATIALTEASWRRIVKINADVNNEIVAVTDQEHWGSPEVWSYPTDGKGDCEDYVLEKRRRLAEAGFPLNALLITVVRDLKGDGHAVLTVKTDRGDFVLDNQVGKIMAWKETGYRFIKRQSDENPMRWVSLGGIDTRTVAAQR
jgi:predicted transglutaminase-like cysteine proteinase